MRDNREAFLPQSPVRTTPHTGTGQPLSFTPYTQRLLRAAAGPILRKPISVQGDPYWTDVFNKDVDGCGSDLDEYARRLLICALTHGHRHTLVDFPAPTDARSLAEERALNRRPYWIEVDPTKSTVGDRPRSQLRNLTQVRIGEKAVVPDGEFGEKVYDQNPCYRAGRYRVFRQEEQKKAMQAVPILLFLRSIRRYSEYELVESGDFSLGQIPLDNLRNK